MQPNRPDIVDGRPAGLEATFERSFRLVAFQMNRHLIDHLLRVGWELTDGDDEAILIWGVLVHQNVAHLLPLCNCPCCALNERGRNNESRIKQSPACRYRRSDARVDAGPCALGEAGRRRTSSQGVMTA